MARFGFVGGSYTSQNPNAATQTCMNMYVESVEIPDKSALIQVDVPGTKSFVLFPTSPVRGSLEFNGRLFVVAGTALYEVHSDGTKTALGTVASDSLPVSFAANRVQVLICSAGSLYIFKLSDNTFSTVVAPPVGNIAKVHYLDGYFIAIVANSQSFYISAIEDGTSWDLTDTTTISLFPENLVSSMVDHRELWLLGNRHGCVYFDSGSEFPFSPVNGVFLEVGAASRDCMVRIDNTVFWISEDERGGRMAWRAQGYTPVRVSNHAIENAWSQFSTVSDAVSYSYQDKGHSFWVVYFPTANKTWVFDVATGLWHERGFWESGIFTAHRSWNHAYCFGKHLVGDWNSGNLYEMSQNYSDYDGAVLRRVRRSPHVNVENERIIHQQLEIALEAGLATFTDESGNPRGPLVMLRWSNDGGMTWTDPRTVDIGQQGQYSTRAVFRRLGMARDRVYEMSFSDAVPLRITDAYLKTSNDSAPIDRMTNQLRKQA